MVAAGVVAVAVVEVEAEVVEAGPAATTPLLVAAAAGKRLPTLSYFMHLR